MQIKKFIDTSIRSRNPVRAERTDFPQFYRRDQSSFRPVSRSQPQRMDFSIGFAWLLCFVVIGNSAFGQQINSVVEDRSLPISVSANDASRWKQGAYDVWHMKGDVRIGQGSSLITADEGIIWSEKADPTRQIPAKLIVYVEGKDVTVSRGRFGNDHAVTGEANDELHGPNWLGRLYSNFGVQFNIPIIGASPAKLPSIHQRALKARDQEGQGASLAQYQQTLQPIAQPQLNGPPAPQPQINPQINPAIAQKQPLEIEFKPRSKNPLNVRTFPSPDGKENVVLYTGGVRVSISGQPIQTAVSGLSQNPNNASSGRVTIEADTVVAWTNPIDQLVRNQVDQSNLRSEVYLEGNIVFSTDDRVVYAEQMYYDVQSQRGTILKAELYTPVEGYDGMLRLKADVLEQIDENNVRAYGSAVTSSRIGVPRYWLQSDVLDLNRRSSPDLNDAGQMQYDPQTGQPKMTWDYEGTSRNNYIYMLGLPVFYWPTLQGNSNQGSFYLNGFSIKNDNVFGFQVYSRFDAFQLFGIRNRPDNAKWDLNLDFLSDRGLGLGTEVEYQFADPYGFRTLNKGQFEAWGLNDDGVDNLGRDRRRLLPEENLRGWISGQHRIRYASGLELSAEVGLVSDRNFLEQFRERVWDEERDLTTGLQLKYLNGEQSFNVSANVQVNDFFTQTGRLPNLNYFLLGRSFLNDRLTWSTHTHAGYQQIRTATTPTNPVEIAKFDPLAWEQEREGIVAATRHEISMPIQTGLFKTTPYAIGEASFYGEDRTGQSLNRTFGQAGVRFSLPMVRFMPNVQDPLFNINGIAHKVEWTADLFAAEASEDFTDLPLYSALDDDAQEHFRRRFFFDSFGGTAGGNIDPRFDERFYAFRSGIQSDVTAASPEIVDDLMAAKFGVNQRWQTKRGPAGRQHTVDWIVLDMEGTFFPKADRDNFGAAAGVLNYDFRWHIGDRFTLLSDGYADVFSQGLRTFSVGTRLTRPETGNLYLGIRSIEGPISANVLNAQVNHRLDDKWAVALGASFDFSKSGNLGQRFAVSRIGESAIMRAGVNVDVSRGTTGFNFVIIPRFIPAKALRKTIGVEIPPLGTTGIE